MTVDELTADRSINGAKTGGCRSIMKLGEVGRRIGILRIECEGELRCVELMLEGERKSAAE
jgi:hypothetical protein